jgi:hypothetical protein
MRLEQRGGDVQLIGRAKRTLAAVANGSLATVSADGRPWNSPLFVAFDADLRFYWSSSVDAEHSRNIVVRPGVFLVVFDSTQPDESGNAVYIRATARELIDEVSIHVALACLARRRNEPPKPATDFSGSQPRRVYEGVPDAMWTNVLRQENGHWRDERIEVDLRPSSPA